MVELAQTIEPWQCVGCGRLQAERPCIGGCSDKMIELVEAAITPRWRGASSNSNPRWR